MASEEPVTAGPQVLLLAPGAVLECTLALPRMSLHAARQVLLFELDKYTPFTPTQVCFDVCLLPGGASQSMWINLVMIERERLDGIVREALALSIEAGWVDVCDPVGRPLGLDLLSGTVHGRARRQARLVRRLLKAACVMLALATLNAWVERREQALETRREELSRARASALEVDGMRKQWQARVEMERAFQLNEEQRLTSVAMLDLLTRCLPEQTWLDSLQASRDGRLQLSGSSERASDLPELLNECAGLRKAVLQGGIQPDRESGRERFTLQARWPVLEHDER
ncbi:PilN domain-containing protein [Pseudomonas huaxiensis]|uniref:PilN domain-containing protein n=1 Tax=Pseudomonas huaxiensis TaxID=2213017 RepID=UPI0013002E32|nr:PilN domain-containing protein [Pseudomonas huaxiensis]